MADLAPIEALRGLLPTGASSFGPVASPLGATRVTVAIDRTLGIDTKTQSIAWKLELSVDGGKNWVPWGGAETVPEALSLKAESSFTVDLPKSADGNTLFRGSVVTKELLGTAITLRMVDDPLPPKLTLAAAHSSVSTAAVTGAAVSSSFATSLTTPSFTITSNANRAGVVGVTDTGSAASITTSIGGVSGTAVTGTSASGTFIGHRQIIHAVIAPPAGSQTASASWTNNDSVTVSAIATSGVNQSTPANNGATAQASGTAGSLAITSTNGDLTVDLFHTDNNTSNETTLNSNQTLQTNTFAAFAGSSSISTGLGTGSQTHTWTGHGTGWIMSGCNLVQASDTLMGQAIL